MSEAMRISESDAVVELWAVTPQGDGKIRVDGAIERCRRELNEWWMESGESPPKLDLVDIRRCVQLRCDLGNEGHQDLRTALVRFQQLDANPEGELKVLGYFSIPESLLAHKPKPQDTYDSITRQLQRNLILLGNRVDEVQIFGEMQLAPKKVVAKMYGARSAIAHGRTDLSDVESLIQNYRGPELISPLADKEQPDAMRRWFSHYVRALTRRLLRCALIEPDLVADLTLD